MDYLEDLNERQKEAVLHTEGPLLVVAGAGTGKTKTLTHRVVHLIKGGVSPREILAITFTNKAANEMRERVATMLDAEDEVPMMCTFHALGVRIIREHHRTVGVNRYFAILDSQDRTSLIKEAMKIEGIDPKEWEPRKIGSVISRAKANEETSESFKVNQNPLTVIAKMVWQRYEALKRAQGGLDFDDLLLETYLLLKNHPDILASYQGRWRYVHVDEYQDTNTIQYQIVRLLAADHQNICAVGDGDQNIYSWRGADMRNILNFEKDFPGAKVVLLETNYRSTKTILAAAHDIIAKNKERIEKRLVTDNEDGQDILVYEAFSAHQEADWVAGRVADYLEGGAEPSDIAVLFRTNFQSRILEEAFLRRSLPYQVVGVKFFERKEVKDVMSYLKVAFNRDSLADIKRIINEPKRGLGKVAVAKIFSGDVDGLPTKARQAYDGFVRILDEIYAFASEHEPSETVRFAIEKSGLGKALSSGTDEDHERLENVRELVTYATKYDGLSTSYDAFFEEVALLSDQDSLGSNGEGTNTVKLSTIHASKGLEFRYVFLVGLEQGLFPSQRDDAASRYEEEEERRLCYVAFTRAKELLHLSYARLRTIYGQERINEPSEFLRDLPDNLLAYDEASFNQSPDDEDGEVATFYLDF